MNAPPLMNNPLNEIVQDKELDRRFDAYVDSDVGFGDEGQSERGNAGSDDQWNADDVYYEGQRERGTLAAATSGTQTMWDAVT